MEVRDRKRTLKIPSRLPSLQGGIHSLDVPLNQNLVTIKKEPESSTGEEWIATDPKESMPHMEDKSVQTLLNIKEEPEASIEEEWIPADPRKSFQKLVAIKKETEEKWSVPHPRDKTRRVKVEGFEDPVTIKKKLRSSTEKRCTPLGPRKSRLHMKVESFEDPVALKREAEPSAEEEWTSTDPGESTLLMEVVEESFEDVASPAQDDSKEKSKTDENEKEAVEESQDWDYDTVYISSEGTYLPKTPLPEGNPNGSERSPPKLSEFERSFLQHLCHTKAEKGPAGENAHKCADCGKTFNFSANLKLHKRFHVKEKPFECLDCGRHFTYKSNLESHQIIHSGEKPFRCDECGRCFSYSWTLQKHQKSHEARRGFVEPKGVPSWIGPRDSYNRGMNAAMRPNTSKPTEAVEFPQLSTFRWSQQGYSVGNK
ncbi:zinc finger protein 232-like [Anolis sagrei]|uniref:zinc finger protein 232-like n=1 Tax=Anolis sagrei TaxID=38937 RepID=UPI00351FCC2A